MLITFYSYKGGVGRTMALANVACLLAEDENHPQRVLVWDFDLEAPGLHRLFPPSEPRRYGFVDLAHRFVSSGELPEVGEYIYESDISGLDVLPAGFLGDSYCRKLQEIDWLGFFSADRESDGTFFGSIREALQKAKYDYVLVDSRTGLNDQAGICTQVLPDLLIFLFRLTDQNLDGLEHLVPAIRAQQEARKKSSVRMLPIASAVSSSAAAEFHKNREDAVKIFGERPLSYIGFDPDLAREEKLFCRRDVRERIWPPPSIVRDYEALSGKIRRGNPADTLTATRKLNELLRQGDLASAETILLSVLKRRPTLAELWRRFGFLLDRDPSSTRREKFKREVETILENDPRNSFALEWKADLAVRDAETPDSDSLYHAKELLEEAIKNDPARAELYRDLAKIYSCKGDLEEAVSAIRKGLELSPDNAQDLLTLADLQIRRGARYFTSAIDAFDQLPKDLGARKYIPLRYLHSFFGDAEKAERSLAAFVPDPEEEAWQLSRLWAAHLKVIEGRKEDGLRIADESLRSRNHRPGSSVQCNWAELFLCAEEFDRAIRVLEASQAECRGCLLALAQYLKQGECGIEAGEVLQAWKGESWGFRELILFRERVKREGDKSLLERLEIIEQLIRHQELEWST